MLTPRVRAVYAVILSAIGGYQPVLAESAAPAANISQITVIDPTAWTGSLNGTWEFAPEDSEEFAPARVPGFWGSTSHAQQVGHKVASQWKSGTYRRDFNVPTGMTGAVLEFDMLRWGGEVFVNGQSAGTYDLGHSPAHFNISQLIRPGTNRLEVKCRGWAALDRLDGKDVQIPIGAGNWFGIKDGGIPDDVTLRLYKDAWIEPLIIQATQPGVPCSVRTRIGSGSAGFKGQIAAQIVEEPGRTAVSAVERKAIQIEPGKVIDAETKSVLALTARPWQPDAPILYRMVVWLEDEQSQPVAVREDTFGFRHLKVVDGRLHLNGQPVPLFGATELVMYSLLQLMDDETALQRLQVDLFKGMNGVAFRSHMSPLPRRWLDLCDRHGILVIPEFPNFPDVQRTSGESPYELPDYPKNLFREARGIVAARMNHPSIVGWSVSNEGSGFGDWERNNLVPYVKSLDPTRFVMLSGDITDDLADQHNFAGMWWGTYGEFLRAVEQLPRFYPTRMLGCSEFGQFDPGKRWYGPREITRQSDEFRNDHARILMEQTEAFRRARYGLIMPYSYGGGWIGKKASETGRIEDAAPQYHALRNALAPLGVSFETPRHALAGTTLEVPVWLYSDAASAAGEVKVSLYLLDKSPGYDWTGRTEGVKILGEAEIEAAIRPWQCLRRSISLELPAEAGGHWLAAVARDANTGQVHAISLKALRLHEPLARAGKRLRVGVIEKDGRLGRWLRQRGHQVVLAYGDIKPDVIVFSEGCLYDERIRTWGASMTGRVRAGTRLVVLEQGLWEVKVMQPDISKALDGLTAVPQQTSLENLFPAPSLARTVGTEEDFQRLNGLDNVAMRVALVAAEQEQSTDSASAPARLTPEAATTQAAAAATQPSVWSSLIDGYGLRAGKPGWALATRSFGRGNVLTCQVPLLGRVDAEAAAQYDPVAERLLVYLIEAQ
jgi:hypothetical protein